MKIGCVVTSLFVFMLLLITGTLEGSAIGLDHPSHFLHKGNFGISSRRLLGFDMVLDYDEAGPNPKHDPRGKKGGGGKP